MTLLRSIAMAFLMFSKIPMPQVEWKDESMHYMLAVFPLIGVVIAALLQLWLWICGALGIGQVLFAGGILLIPLAVTGGIHIDGLCDTSDALGSHAEPERKREILKDPRVGAFGVIAVVAYVALYFALASDLPQTVTAVGLMGIAHVLSRVTSGTISMFLAGSTEEGLLATFRGASHRVGAAVILGVFALACVICGCWLNWICTIVIVVIDIACALFVHQLAKREFGGMSGDLAGYFLQVAEAAMLAGIVIALHVL